MKLNKWALPLVFGWFFAVQSPAQTPGALVTTVIGPFSSEAACKAEFDELKDMMDQLGLHPKYAPCSYRQEA